MMEESTAIEQYAIEQTSALFTNESLPVSVAEAKSWLSEQVMYLLNHDFNKLVNLLYRIDVYESKAKTCFGKSNNEIAMCLAELIWERQMEKARRKYQ
jgi:hypothetical protein